MIQFIIPMLAAIAASLVGVFVLGGRIPSILSNLLIVALCWIGIAGSQWALTQFPDFAGLEVFFPNQVWQRILWPLGLLFLWSAAVESFSHKLPESTRLLLYVVAFGLTIYASLPFAPIWDDMIPENAMWLLASLCAAVCNMHAISTMLDDQRVESGKRWAMWLLVANFGAIAGVMFSQIGSLGEWCLAAMLMAAVFAAAISISGNSTWIKAIVPSLCLLAACLVANIRFYATEVKPWWLFVVLFSMPTAIVLVDLILEKRLKKPVRLVISGVLGFVTSFTVIVSVWISTASTESW